MYALPVAQSGAVCGRCVATPPRFDRSTALAHYAPPVDGMVMALKFRARLDRASMFGGLLARRAPPANDALVVPLPLAFERISERGINQSSQIARAYATAAGARLSTQIIRRIRHAAPQQALARAQRRRNIRGGFDVPLRIDSACVLVVDDVMTSGSTMDEAARALKAAAGAATVHALVVARTP